MPSTITKKQQGLFFSKGTPLSNKQKKKLEKEIKSGTVKIKKDSLPTLGQAMSSLYPPQNT